MGDGCSRLEVVYVRLSQKLIRWRRGGGALFGNCGFHSRPHFTNMNLICCFVIMKHGRISTWWGTVQVHRALCTSVAPLHSQGVLFC